MNAPKNMTAEQKLVWQLGMQNFQSHKQDQREQEKVKQRELLEKEFSKELTKHLTDMFGCKVKDIETDYDMEYIEDDSVHIDLSAKAFYSALVHKLNELSLDRNQTSEVYLIVPFTFGKKTYKIPLCLQSYE